MVKTAAKLISITIDAETKTIVENEQNRLETELGFKPTLSQTVRHIVKIGNNATPSS